MDKKIRVLCIPSDTAGCGLHRSLAPHVKLGDNHSDDFEVIISYDVNWRDLDFINSFDIIHFHKGLFSDIEGFHAALDFCKQNNIVTIMDVDDYWEVGQHHPLYYINKNNNSVETTKANLRKADYVTTTTPIFANLLKKYNPNVNIFVNALCPEEMSRLKEERNNKKIRIGFIMGSSHEHDMELVRGLANKLPKDIIKKIQFVLCGYDLRGVIYEQHADGTTTERNIRPEESVWYTFEKNVTDNYSIVSPEYKEFLLNFIPNSKYHDIENESYRRCWTRTVDGFEYMRHYNELDILLVPLQSVEFCKYKSELKFVEAGMMNVAVIASDFGPYTIGSVNFFEKGGKINENGNCVLIDNKKAHKLWAKTIEKLVNNPEYIDMLKANMNKHILENYDINKITVKRAEWYKEICKRK